MGGGLAGLLLARVLSERAQAVVLVERDRLPSGDVDRKGVPQGRHAHALLARGQAVYESLFPGLRAELRSKGAMFGDLADQRWMIQGRLLPLPEGLGPGSFMCSRPLLERCVRARVSALPNVEVRDGTLVSGLLASAGCVRGVRVRPSVAGATEEALAADLTVDATGRGSKLPVWLEALGYAAPAEERLSVGVRYATVWARRHPRHADGGQCVVVAAAPPNRRCGVAIAVDADRWLVTLQGYLGEPVGGGWHGMVEFARGLPCAALYTLMQDSQPLSEVVTATFPYSRFRRYDRLKRHPDGVLAAGDAICSLNPIFAQGMTIAALSALELAQVLKTQPLPRAWPAFYQRYRSLLAVPWSMAAGNDLRFAELEGPRTRAGELLSKYMDRLTWVAGEDPDVAAAFLHVAHMLAPPTSLMHPKIVWRVARASLRRPSI